MADRRWFTAASTAQRFLPAELWREHVFAAAAAAQSRVDGKADQAAAIRAFMALSLVKSAIKSRVRGGILEARGRPGSPLASFAVIPGDAWRYLKLDLDLSTASMPDGTTVYSVEFSLISVPTTSGGRNRSERKKANEINDVPTVPTVPTDKHNGPDGNVSAAASPPAPHHNLDVSEEEMRSFIDAEYAADGRGPGRDLCEHRLREHFRPRRVNRALFRSLHKGRQPPGRPPQRGVDATPKPARQV